MNTLKTTLLLTALTLLLVYGGAALGGQQGMVMAFMFALVMNFGAYWFSDKIVLAMYHAQPLKREDAPEIYSIVEELARESRIPMPKLYLIPHGAPNAFATGRSPSHAAVAVTGGIVELLNREELRGVLAHELAHVTNRDTLISTVAATIAGAISMLANMAQWAMIFGGGRRDDRGGHNPLVGLIMIVVAPIAAALIQMAISRSREFQADETGAKLCRDPLSLASALRKLEAGKIRRPLEANPATAHMFIVNPLAGDALMHLFSTHPPIKERVARLERMARANPLVG